MPKLFLRISLVVRGMLMFKDWPLWLLHRFGLLRRTTTGKFRMRNGAEFLLDFREHNPGMFQEIWLMDLYERHYALRQGDVVIDIGACVGAFAVRAARKGAKVFAYEPTPRSFELLKKNTAGYGVSVFNLAVAGAPGAVTVYEVPGGAEGNSMYVSGDAKKSFTAASTTIEDILKKNAIDDCSLLKIDCEGAEAVLLESMTEKTAARIRNIALEYHRNGDIVSAILLRKGYRIIEKGTGDYGYMYAEKI